jgi:hypothetical protein
MYFCSSQCMLVEIHPYRSLTIIPTLDQKSTEYFEVLFYHADDESYSQSGSSDK